MNFTYNGTKVSYTRLALHVMREILEDWNLRIGRLAATIAGTAKPPPEKSTIRIVSRVGY